jgi:protein SCO1/2
VEGRASSRPIAVHRHRKILFLALFACSASVAMAAYTGQQQVEQKTEPPRPEILSRAGFDQKLNAQLPLDLSFRDETGATVRLGDYFGKKPVVIMLAYYSCPMLCTLVLNGVGETLRDMKLALGEDYEVVTVSIDPTDKPELAAKKKENYAKEFKLADGGRGWHFLVGEAAAISNLAATVGFTYAYDEKSEEYAHASGIMVATPGGKLSHYFYGVTYPARDVRLGLVEASAGRIGSPVDQLMLFCYHYDPVTGTYTAAVMDIIRLGSVATILSLGTFLVVMLRRESRLHPAEALP